VAVLSTAKVGEEGIEEDGGNEGSIEKVGTDGLSTLEREMVAVFFPLAVLTGGGIWWLCFHGKGEKLVKKERWRGD